MFVGDIDHVPEWFTEDFELHDPSFGGLRSGHNGARDMLRSLAEHVPNARVNAPDMVEEGGQSRDAVAFLWQKGWQPCVSVGGSNIPFRGRPYRRRLGNRG